MRISEPIERYRVSSLPGSRNYRRAINGLLRQLANVALSGRRSLTLRDKVALFTLVSEYSVAAIEAATIASSGIVTVSVPNDTFVVQESLLSMLYLDHLVFGYATFELAGDIIVYADPTQFTSISLKPDGSVDVIIRDSEDISDRVGVVTIYPNPFIFGFSVPELIPQTFMTLLLYRNRIVYDLSQFRKPEFLVITSEMLSPEEVLNKRRSIIEQAEDDYGSVMFYSHSGDEKPQVVVFGKDESLPREFINTVYEREVELLRQMCGLPTDGKLSAIMVSFFEQLRSEIERLLTGARVEVGLPDINGDDK
mgnify:FL=1